MLNIKGIRVEFPAFISSSPSVSFVAYFLLSIIALGVLSLRSSLFSNLTS